MRKFGRKYSQQKLCHKYRKKTKINKWTIIPIIISAFTAIMIIPQVFTLARQTKVDQKYSQRKLCHKYHKKTKINKWTIIPIIISAFTAIMIIPQVFISIRQTEISIKQAEISERQAEFSERQMNITEADLNPVFDVVLEEPIIIKNQADEITGKRYYAKIENKGNEPLTADIYRRLLLKASFQNYSYSFFSLDQKDNANRISRTTLIDFTGSFLDYTADFNSTYPLKSDNNYYIYWSINTINLWTAFEYDHAKLNDSIRLEKYNLVIGVDISDNIYNFKSSYSIYKDDEFIGDLTLQIVPAINIYYTTYPFPNENKACTYVWDDIYGSFSEFPYDGSFHFRKLDDSEREQIMTSSYDEVNFREWWGKIIEDLIMSE